MNPIDTEKGAWVMGAIVDVSERKRSEDSSGSPWNRARTPLVM